jgi:hypothetical protein
LPLSSLLERLLYFVICPPTGDCSKDWIGSVSPGQGDRSTSSKQGETQVTSLFSRIGKLGVTGVPFFIIQRHLAVSGAQTGEVLAAAILQAMQSKPGQ